MPTLHEIFGRAINLPNGKYVIVRDRKPEQCSYIDNTEESPFIKRCPYPKVHNLTVCKRHAFTVNYLDGRGIERTAFFDTIGKAEYFKRRGTNWLECNYVPPVTD
jgi:hypothetical protein